MSIGGGCYVVLPETMSHKLELRELGNLPTIRVLQKVINKEHPAIVFLMKTKLDLEWMGK